MAKKTDPVMQIILNAYRPRFERQFEHHPQREEIVDKLVAGDNPIELVELWFAEADRYSAEHMLNTIGNATPDAEGNIRFERFDGATHGEDDN